MSTSTPEQDPAAHLDAEAKTPTPTPSSGVPGEFTATGPTVETPAQGGDDGSDEAAGGGENATDGEAEKPSEADSPEDADPSEVPSTEELEEPSTEKEPSEEPKAPARNDPEPDHEAVGIGVIDGPETDEGD
ncbi:hypothetical protein [Microbacterium sp. H83]|uniref:hypothetical protein n=1 Tax=Microbacterium sp. H83 TaxID=1827324 RepID=UPI000AF91488|nr:hypothetical protein [Microbacterium sp. H83]